MLHRKSLVPPVHQVVGIVEVSDFVARDGEDELVAGYLSPRSRGVARESIHSWTSVSPWT